MDLMATVKALDGHSHDERFEIIVQLLEQRQIPYNIQKYSSGQNIFSLSGSGKKIVGVGSHYDAVPGSPGANDNASAIAVGINILDRLKTYRFKNFNVCVFFFDEEESGLKGSEAYLNEYGTENLLGLLNIEMVGMGDKFALWPVGKESGGPLLKTFENVASGNGIFCGRFDKIVTNTADHASFRKAGINDAFSITTISDREIEVSREYYLGQEQGKTKEELLQIMRKAPLFVHYHQPTDRSEHLNNGSLLMAAEAIWETLRKFDQEEF